MAVYRLEPAKKSAIWGGRRLIEEFGKEFDGDNLAETWELSVHPDGPCRIASGDCAGLTLPEYISKKGENILGKNCRRFEDFPILIKLIDAKADLSIQVHPDNEYAREHEGQYGKTEMWYVMDASPGATLCYGCKEKVSKEEFRQQIEDGTLDQSLNMVPVAAGDVFFIKAGTIHAIGGGILIAEIQQNSNVTYRVYDYNRKGADGKLRELHVEKALDVSELAPPQKDFDFDGHIGLCDCFITDLVKTEGSVMTVHAGEDSFICVLVVDGTGTIENGGDELTAKRGECFFAEAGSGDCRLDGDMTAIVVKIPE